MKVWWHLEDSTAAQYNPPSPHVIATPAPPYTPTTASKVVHSKEQEVRSFAFLYLLT